MKHVFLCAALLALSPQVHAQQAQRAPGVQASIDPGTAFNGAVQVLNLVDSNRVAEIWEGGSPVMKRLVSREGFVQQTQRARSSLGNVVERNWQLVVRRQVSAGEASAELPAGNYVSINFESRFSSGRRAVELVTFRQDEDGVWRATGYSLM